MALLSCGDALQFDISAVLGHHQTTSTLVCFIPISPSTGE
jgi:hypothetical protein